MGGWLSLVTHRPTLKAAETFRAEVIEDNRQELERYPDDLLAPDNALCPAISRISIKTKQQMLDELALAARAGQP